MTEPSGDSATGRDPRHNADLIGHTEAEARLVELWTGGHMPHAVMISGRPGIGKATLAYRLARFVLAGEGGSVGLFGDTPDSLALAADHPTFRRVASGGHVDLMVLERPWDEKRGRRKGVIPMDQAQKAVNFLRLTSGEGGWRVVLVDAADDLNVSSANALLKVLEEPPQQVLLILVVNAVGQVLPTIRSRCRHLALSPLSDDQVRAVIEIRRDDLPDTASGDVDLAIALADGSPGQALALLEAGAARIYKDFIEVLQTMPDYDLTKALAFADMVGPANDDTPFSVFIDVFTGWLARVVHGTVVEAANSSLGDEQIVNARLTAQGTLDPWFEVWDKAGAWFSATNGLNLERKQTVLAVIDACAEAARRAAGSP